MVKLTLRMELEIDEMSQRLRFAAGAALIVAGLVAFASLGGILIPSTYAGETASWRVQGIAQDWADLVLAVPWLVVSAIFVLRGSRRARLVLGGGLAYTLYSFLLYAFAVHFNWLFLIYCGVLGGSAFALVALGSELSDEDVRGWFDTHLPRRSIAVFEIACGAIFALLWLAQILPAIARGAPPEGLAEVGLITNPVHVLDLSFVLPAMILGGVELWRRKPLGYALAGILLGFGVLMTLNLAGLMVGMYVAKLAPDVTMVIGFAAIAAVAGVLLGLMLRSVERTTVFAR